MSKKFFKKSFGVDYCEWMDGWMGGWAFGGRISKFMMDHWVDAKTFITLRRNRDFS